MTKYRKIIYVVLCIVVPVLFSGCEREHHPVAGKDAFQDISVYENQSGVLLGWLKNGYRDMVAVNVDYHDDLRLIPEEKIRILTTLVETKDWEGIASNINIDAKSLYTDADYLYAAYRLGVIKKLFWISPSRLLEVPDAEQSLQLFLRAFGYPDEVVRSFKRDGAAFTGDIHGLEVTISSVQGLPQIKEPVLFMFNSDYFSKYLFKEKAGEVQLLTDFFIILGSKDIKVKHLSLAYQDRDPVSDIIYRHITNELQYLFQNPDTLLTGAVPGLWRLRASGMELLREEQPEFALQTFDDALETFPNETSIHAGRAVALALLGRDDEALEAPGKHFKGAPEYDLTLLHIGDRLARKGDNKRAERYIKTFLEIHPKSVDGLMKYGDLLYNTKRDADALRVYEQVLEYGEKVRATMYAGDALMQLGRFDEASEYYLRGVRLVNETGYLSMRDFPAAVHNIRFLESRGR